MGGTGTVGRHVVAGLAARGHEVRALTRHAREHPVDLTTGAGLAAALDGVDVVVAASTPATSLRHV
ncbi:NAD-dependent epimerase/dehydratase family protein, partial [Cellulosimicrobium funkei]|uniref:NAD-dependent epimerase/dehydratase family protein n=1 Tax=Cellulosimicrobium funkei TaxID=264251 RepID=UPI0030FA206F